MISNSAITTINKLTIRGGRDELLQFNGTLTVSFTSGCFTVFFKISRLQIKK